MSNINKIFLLTLMMSCNDKKTTITEQNVVNVRLKSDVNTSSVNNRVLLKSINRKKVFTRAINEVNKADLIIEEYETKM